MSDKDPKEWKEQLTPEQYEVCINHGTEPPFSGKYNDSKLEGSFKCICCGEELFSSNSKFDSGSGWPSFLGTNIRRQHRICIRYRLWNGTHRSKL